MGNTKKPSKVLLIGELWHIHMIHSKGYDSFTSGKCEEGATWLLQCLRNSQVDVIYMPAHMIQIAFPEDVAQSGQYDAIVINDIGSNTFPLQNDTSYQPHIKPNALEPTKEYVNNGGRSLVIGGYLSFMGIEAKANCKNIALVGMLPVTTLDGDDRVERPGGVTVQPSQPEHSVIRGFSEYPLFPGYNRTTAKENAEVILTVNNNPLLVFGNYHNRETACFMNDCSPHQDIQQSMSWSFYIVLWVNILIHIAG